MTYANTTETGWCQMAQWMVDTIKDAVNGLCKHHRDWLMPNGTMNGWYNKGHCGWFMQTTQRLVDAKWHNEWLIQQRTLWMVYANNKETGWCQMTQWMVDTTKDAVDGLCKQHRDWLMPNGTMNGWYNKGCCGWFMQTPQRLVDAKWHNEWLIQQRTLWMFYANTTETGWCQMAQWMVDTTKNTVDGLCKQHKDWLMPNGTMNGWYNKGHCGWFMQTTQRLVDAKWHNEWLYNKGCCGWFMQTPQRLVDAKGHNEWLIQQRTLWMVYANTTETGWCQRAQW